MSAELVTALAQLLKTADALINDPLDFGPYTESCKREYQKAKENASKALRAYRKENNGKSRT
jgi:hypothetical protein